MNDIFVMRLEEIQPSQLFISSEKLSKAMRHIDFLRPETVRPIPVRKLGDQVIFTDGHTRAFAAFLWGRREVRVFWDEDDLDWEAYEICVNWCKDAGIYMISDLKNKIVDADEYELLWLRRCKEMHQDLEMKRERR